MARDYELLPRIVGGTEGESTPPLEKRLAAYLRRRMLGGSNASEERDREDRSQRHHDGILHSLPDGYHEGSPLRQPPGHLPAPDAAARPGAARRFFDARSHPGACVMGRAARGTGRDARGEAARGCPGTWRALRRAAGVKKRPSRAIAQATRAPASTSPLTQPNVEIITATAMSVAPTGPPARRSMTAVPTRSAVACWRPRAKTSAPSGLPRSGRTFR